MSTLHQNLARLKLAMLEEANKTDSSVKEDDAVDGNLEIELKFNLTLDFRF